MDVFLFFLLFLGDPFVFGSFGCWKLGWTSFICFFQLYILVLNFTCIINYALYGWNLMVSV